MNEQSVAELRSPVGRRLGAEQENRAVGVAGQKKVAGLPVPGRQLDLRSTRCSGSRRMGSRVGSFLVIDGLRCAVDAAVVLIRPIVR